MNNYCPTFVIRLSAFVTALVLVMLLASAGEIDASEQVKNKPRLGLPDKTRTYLDRSYGFSLDLSEDFELTSEQGDLLFFRSAQRPGTVIIRPRPDMSLSTVQGILRTGFESEQIRLTPTGAPRSVTVKGGQGLSMDVEGKIEGREIRGTFAGIFGGDHQGYMILIGSVKERWPGFESSARTMLGSFSIVPVEAGHEHDRWQQRMMGKRLIFVQGYGNYYNGGVGVSEYHFCSDGSYLMRTDSSDTYNDAWGSSTYGTTSKGKGTWRVQFLDHYPTLVMRANGGNQSSYPLSENEGYVFLGDMPYRFARNDLCR